MTYPNDNIISGIIKIYFLPTQTSEVSANDNCKDRSDFEELLVEAIAALWDNYVHYPHL